MRTPKHSQRPTRSILWHTQPYPSQRDHQLGVINHEVVGALKRCVKCGSLEVK